jgi:aryl-alcohol dehydrogenase-like predicted oxidoreductase
MNYTSLGSNELKVSPIDIGTEHLLGQPREWAVPVIGQAVEHGINYLSLTFTMPATRLEEGI